MNNKKIVIKEIDKVSETSTKTLPNFVKFDLNLDTLKIYLEEISDMLSSHSVQLDQIENNMLLKASEKTVAHYLLKIAEGLQKECGERPHRNRLNEKDSLDEHY